MIGSAVGHTHTVSCIHPIFLTRQQDTYPASSKVSRSCSADETKLGSTCRLSSILFRTYKRRKRKVEPVHAINSRWWKDGGGYGCEMTAWQSSRRG